MNNIIITNQVAAKYYDLAHMKYITGTPQTSFTRQYPKRNEPYKKRYATKDYILDHVEYNHSKSPLFHEVIYTDTATNVTIVTTLTDDWLPLDQQYYLNYHTMNRIVHRQYLPALIHRIDDNFTAIGFFKDGINIDYCLKEYGEMDPFSAEWEFTYDMI